MAKSKSGGTRSMLRGRVGSDVYSVGRDAKGKRQQVVRSLAETVANPQTVNQMRGRMIMSTIMQAQSALKPIIDHSFDNVSGVQPNLSEFISRNYAKIKADVAANPAGSNTFGLVMYNEKGAKKGAYIISDGQAAVPAALTINKTTGVITIDLGAEQMTMGGLKAALGLGAEEYFTLVGLDDLGGAEYERFHINQSLADDTAIAAGNLDQIFNVEGNAIATLAISGNTITITLAAIAGCCAFIVTRKTNSGFAHSKATLGSAINFDYTADVALPSYPVGENKFLNGGSQSFSPAPSPSPSPTPTPTEQKTLTYSFASGITSGSVRAGGASINSGASVEVGASCSVSGVVAESGYHMEARLNGNAISLTKNGTTYSGTFDMPNANSTLTMTKVADSPGPEPTPSGRELLIDGGEVTIGNTHDGNLRGDSPGVLTLPANDAYIGKSLVLNDGTGVTAILVGTLTQGTNNFTITLQEKTMAKANKISVGTDADGEWIQSDILCSLMWLDDD